MTGKLHLHTGIALDVAHPGDMRVDAVNRDPHQLYVQPLKISGSARELNELRGTHRGEIGRVGKQQYYLPLLV